MSNKPTIDILQSGRSWGHMARGYSVQSSKTAIIDKVYRYVQDEGKEAYEEYLFVTEDDGTFSVSVHGERLSGPHRDSIEYRLQDGGQPFEKIQWTDVPDAVRQTVRLAKVVT